MNNIYSTIKSKFNLGTVVKTQGASDLIISENLNATELVMRHASGDWGNICAEDKATNEESIKSKGMILSCYGEGDKRLWIITDPGHEVTTLLRPDEY